MRPDRGAYLLLLAVVAAVWPVWKWLAYRALQDVQAAVPLLSLVSAIAFLWCNRDVRTRAMRPESVLPASWTLSLLLVSSYAATYHFLPPLGRALIAMAALAAACSAVVLRKQMDARVAGLMLLSLPVIPTLNFYLGYPLRTVVAELTSLLLRLNGLAVWREGVGLRWGAGQVAVDAPCSGVKMLWAGLFLSFAIAAILRLRALRTVALVAAGSLIVLMANVLRATALFYVETRLVPARPLVHEFVGLIVFGSGAAAIAWVAARIRGVRYAA